MTHARIITPWIYDESFEGNVPKIIIDVPTVNDFNDMINTTNVPPTPNINVGLTMNVNDSIINDIINHPEYGKGAILLTNKDEGTKPTQAVFNQTRDFLMQLGATSDQVDAAIGAAPNNRTRFAISNDLIEWLKANT